MRLAIVNMCILLSLPETAFAQPQPVQQLQGAEVLESIGKASEYLLSQQRGDGSWALGPEAGEEYPVGVTSLAVMGLINAGRTIEDRAVSRGLTYLRSRKPDDVGMTYEVSLLIMALTLAKDGDRDYGAIAALARKLERAQTAQGEKAGLWTYSAAAGGGGGDPSNGQFAVLGLREAAHAGVPIDRDVWLRARAYWRRQQKGDGSWSYYPSDRGTGSMTVAGVSTLVICEEMLKEDQDRNPDGSVNCCNETETDPWIEKGVDWLGKNFQRGSNPGAGGALLYYMYGMERAGRLSGHRFFGEHDWYREIAEFLIRNGQNRREGWFRGQGFKEYDRVLGTCYALLFLSKGLSPVLVNKLEYGPLDPRKRNEVLGNGWRPHLHDARNITLHISGLKKWPKLLTWQTVNIKKSVAEGNVQALLQSPVLYITGSVSPEFTPQELAHMKEYVNQGGFILAAGNCSPAFDDGFRRVVHEMYRDEGIDLRPLTSDHPIFRSEYLLEPESVPLEGADFGCRTAIVLAPAKMNMACLWDKWAVQNPPQRDNDMKLMINKSMQVGVNIIAYATGREPPQKLDPRTQLVESQGEDPIERGLLQVAKLRHGGGWDTAPQALRNLLIYLNKAAGATASERPRELLATDPNLFKYPLLYMHGRNGFTLSLQERRQIRKYLDNGGVLFADACCGSPAFDKSFRELMAQLYPEHEFKQIPVTREAQGSHELFTTAIAYDIRTVRRKTPEADNPNAALNTNIREVQPFLEGIEIDGRYVVIYSKYDISCALQRQASVACSGYVPEDAARIAINVLLYALLQDVYYREVIETGKEPAR